MRVRLSLALLLAGCVSPAAQESAYGPYRRPVNTRSAAAAAAFQRGLIQAYGFNRDEAAAAFRAAAAADPYCAMAWWGLAYALGPDINFPMGPEQARAAYEAIQRAAAEAGSAAPVERALIAAMQTRYAWPAPEDRKPLDQAYAAAMEQVWRQYPNDPDVAALYAEALMDLRPWDLWTAAGEPQPGTTEIVRVLEAALAAHPLHPALLHFHIHAIEMSPQPERALVSADALSGLVPASGHLLHMPSHIYVRVGRYADAVAGNREAVAADAAYVRAANVTGPYLFYFAHNYHLLAYAAMMQGSSAEAIAAARASTAVLPPELLDSMTQYLDGYATYPMHALLRFGRWEDVLAEPKPVETLRVATAFWHYARGVALANLDRLADAQAEAVAFAAAAGRVQDGDLVGLNPARAVLHVAERMLQGEILARQGQTDEALDALRAAVQAEDGLAYNEPPDWTLPVRHALGAVLVNAGRHGEAEAVYRADLAKNPANGWSLFGLAECLRARGAGAEAEATERQFRDAWRHADVALTASCYCQAR